MRTRTFATTILCLLLTGCGSSSQAATGVVEIGAVTTCEAGSHPECIAVMDQHILLDAADFEPAGVVSVAATEQDGHEVVEVTFDEQGAQEWVDLILEGH